MIELAWIIMRKFLLIAIIVGLAFSADAAKIKMKDMPDDHWAAASVYDLVRLGVTKGYPDGTYRGNKPITRYETAIFLSKLASALGGEELKKDLQATRDQLAELKKAPATKVNFSGKYEADWRLGNLFSTSGGERGAVTSYRLILTASREISENADLKVNLDTMDFGYFDDGTSATAGRGLLATDLLDIESNIKLDGIKLKLFYGPGPKQHAADPTGFLPSEVGVTYIRPDRGITAATQVYGLALIGSYIAEPGATQDATGKVDTSRVSGTVSFNLSRFKVDLTGDYMSHGLFSTSDRNIKAKISLATPLGEKARVSTTVGLARAASQMMVAGDLALNDVWDTGTVMTIKAAKVGSDYISDRFSVQQFDFAGFDFFDRPLENGIVSIGGELVQSVSDRARLVGKGDLRLNSDYTYQGGKAKLTAQGGVSYSLAPDVNLDAAYRVYQDKGRNDTSDLASLGLIYRF